MSITALSRNDEVGSRDAVSRHLLVVEIRCDTVECVGLSGACGTCGAEWSREGQSGAE